MLVYLSVSPLLRVQWCFVSQGPAFHCVLQCLFMYLCQCMLELVLVNLCSQRSSVVHMGADPLCFVSKGHSAFEHSFCVIAPPPPSLLSTVYVISV